MNQVLTTFNNAVDPAMVLLPDPMDSRRARVQLAATMLQESRGIDRHQIGGPAHGLWQFEQGTRKSRGGVWGVYLHEASAPHLRRACSLLRCDFDPVAIYTDIEFDDVLACVVARLLLWTDRQPLPAIGDTPGAWDYYLRNWNPGKPKPGKWPLNYSRALAMVPA